MGEPKANDPNAAAAHVFLTELSTRIATQRLHFSEGDEAAALASLHALFGVARKTITDHFGCEDFARETLGFLNGPFRSFMADWHRKSLAGLLNTRDGAVAFRAELRAQQDKMRVFAATLHQMAYGTAMPPFPPDRDPQQPPRDTLAFGIPDDGVIPSGSMVEQINRSEAEAIAKRREKVATSAPDADGITNAAGLALSGGGIRSASFCLGVSQVLSARAGIMNSFDLMSTVSGGGFTGSFLTRRIADQGVEAVARPNGPDTDAVKYLRQRANYLSMGSFIKTSAIAMNLLAGMVLNWTAPAAIIAVITLLLHLLGVSGWDTFFGLLPVVGGACLLAALLSYAWVPYRWGAVRIAALWGFFLLTGAFFLIYGIHLFYGAFLTILQGQKLTATLSLAALAAAGPALSRVLPMLGKERARIIGVRILLIIASIAVPFLALIVGCMLFYLGHVPGEKLPAFFGAIGIRSGLWLLAVIALALVLTTLLTLNINATGPHWLYRQQIANTFIRLGPTGEVDVPLSSLDPEHKAPYLLINAVTNLPTSDRIEMRERQGDFFLFSKHWCGSPLVGYHPTAHWRHWRNQEVDLATAVATSGAAVAPHMALLSVSSARALLSFLNLRLGFWLRRPAPEGEKATGGRPGARMLMREMFALKMDETQDWMMLTDGAHLDNSAIYELLRRRCKHIVAVDASADPNGSFDTILTLLRHAAVDLGVRIHADLKELRPDAETGLTRAHGVMCEIDYPAVDGRPAGKGLLLLIKLSMTGDENELINAYRHAHPEFPNQSTIDQFFDEHQFEAFRQLGVHAAESLFKEALIGAGEVDDVASWLERLYLRIPPQTDATISSQ